MWKEDQGNDKREQHSISSPKKKPCIFVAISRLIRYVTCLTVRRNSALLCCFAGRSKLPSAYSPYAFSVTLGEEVWLASEKAQLLQRNAYFSCPIRPPVCPSLLVVNQVGRLSLLLCSYVCARLDKNEGKKEGGKYESLNYSCAR